MSISIVIPTFNEEENIAQLIGYLKEHGENMLREIIVSDGNSNDLTVHLAAKAGAKVIKSPIRSRAAQMNLGANHASGNVLCFMHADVIPPKTYIRDILDATANGYDFGCFRHKFNSKKSVLVLTSALWRKMNINVFGGDQVFFILRIAFESLNGFNEKYVIMEDFELADRARKMFRRTIIQKEVLASDRKYDHNNYLKVNIYNIIAYMMYRFGIQPIRIKRFYQMIYNYK